MLELSTIQYDKSAIDDGVWKKIEVDGASFEVKLRSEDSEEYLAAETKHFSRLREDLNPTPRQRVEAKLESIVEGGLIDWRNLSLDGDDFEFTLENARWLFLSREFQGLGEAMLMVFRDRTAYLKSQQEAREKNLKIA